MTTNGILIGMTGPFVISPVCFVRPRRAGCFCKLELVSFRKELGELSISICALLPCSSKSIVFLFVDYGARRELCLSGEYCVGCFVFVADWMFAYMVVGEVFY